MDLTPYVETLRRELATAAEAGGEDARELADRLTAPLESAVRLTLLEALSAAADEITRDMAPGSVELRLRGRDPGFVVTPRLDEAPRAAEPAATAAAPADDVSGERGPMTRINLRLPDDLKARIEEAAARERMSVNTWLVRAAAGMLGVEPAPRPAARPVADSGRRYTGWVR
ncbi:toxin-antitoxin system HicB family antitoxin [Catellatospora sp. KI3]|uniref:toxin-antitoxin system HicB family antitoxin n=1 Tax=Catellatospora sp. KI3 TaxID=3041620 RepID=UPI002482B626|nr:toxin-antitoxin system HicB family antitoxin [Catellatospora sp. KI3]MDI1461596.1 toxin-antitoxin system HicB family antitoxin [Catellatospora sp. KI3]